ncbi:MULTISPECIES: hypothetical protein [unclassified Oceanispirochaeta]|uniref:hypothetical protein n=1 Tax=unclassified Oceanispirochaeta TaxID=2635722 RepID=UPI000E0920B2|nr:MULTISPECIES: hypothetical protein [unclassified Oceanispirochaeta]MBF9017007.1 hypothetical protein [Oceanispirochaeta sp. M2]NPD73370.1 hypothetical protein [Oceanispirochaeta sp. M1]RDG31025.1 hypothetical protein DV872_14810 [Oceanispirochaeta sp. M1]
MSKFTYSLRIGICPGFHSDEKLENLVGFCREAGIDDIQFHMNMEEINQGHLTVEETEPWLEMMKSFKDRLKKEGLLFSLNPWTTTVHTDRGRTLKTGQEFTTMRDFEGQSAAVVACPLDRSFLDYLTGMYTRYAELGFDILWVEDDFRIHNHAPLAWGGCFCDEHMKRFSEAAGRELNREEFVREMLQPGKVHPSRKVWLDTMRRTMSEFSHAIGEAVRSAAPRTRIGLMSSAPQAHCVEGRDWKAVMTNFSGVNRPLNRPHLPAYREIAGPRYCLEFQRYSRLTAAFLSAETELWPELDNFPHTTFSKSHTFAAFQIEASLALCSEGITINISDMIGNGIAERQNNQAYLKRLRPYLDGVARLELKRTWETGVRVMVDPDSSYTLKTDRTDTPDGLRPWETFWAEYLSSFGIANVYCLDPRVTGQTVAVGGQYFRNLCEDDIRHLLENNQVLLDGEAVDTLLDMGLRHLLPVESSQWLGLNTGGHSFEQVCNGRVYQSLPQARMSAQAMSETLESGDWLKLSYHREMEVFTELRSPGNEYAGPGIVRRDNLIIFPFGRIRDEYLFLLNPVRQEILQELLKETGRAAVVMVKDLPYVTVNHFDSGDSQVLLLTNFGSDAHDHIDLLLPFEAGEACLISRESGEPEPVRIVRAEEGTWRLEHSLQGMTSLCLIIKV